MNELNSENQLGRRVVTNRNAGTTLAFGAAAAVTYGANDANSGGDPGILSSSISYVLSHISFHIGEPHASGHFHLSYDYQHGLSIDFGVSGDTGGPDVSMEPGGK